MIARLPLILAGEPTDSRDSVQGPAGLELAAAPPLRIRQDLSRTGQPAPLSSERRRALLTEALELFSDGTVMLPTGERQDWTSFAEHVSAAVGLPVRLVATWSRMLRDNFIAAAPHEVRGSSAALVSLPANTLLCLDRVLAHLGAGRRVWIRPPTREPWSSLRLVGALREVGWPREALYWCPTSHDTLARVAPWFPIVEVFGGREVASRFDGMPGVVVHGPGRAVAFADEGLEEDAIAREVGDHAGRLCRNVHTVVSGDPRCAQRLADRLAGLSDIAWFPSAPEAEAVCRWVRDRLLASDRLLLGRLEPVPVEGGVRIDPVVISAATLEDHPLAGMEPPFVCAVVGPASAVTAARLRGAARFVFPREPN